MINKSYVHASYGVAIAYVFADTFDKSYKSYQKDQSLVKSAKIGGDVVIWQLLASVSKSNRSSFWADDDSVLGDDSRLHNQSHLLDGRKRFEARQDQTSACEMDSNDYRIAFDSSDHPSNRQGS